MRILLLGGTGNLGSRLIPALLAHKHTVIALVRFPAKLQKIITPALWDKISVVEGDALDTQAVAAALRQHNCDAVMNTAGNFVAPWKEQVLGKIAASVSSAAIAVGKERGKPLRAWVIGGMGSLEYPGTGWKIEDYFPKWGMEHHRQTAVVMQKIDTRDLEWTLLCVAWMFPRSPNIDVIEQARESNLLVAARSPPGWVDHWIRKVPLIGVYLNIIPAMANHSTYLEDVANMIAYQFAGNDPRFIGELVGMKTIEQKKSQ